MYILKAYGPLVMQGEHVKCPNYIVRKEVYILMQTKGTLQNTHTSLLNLEVFFLLLFHPN